jgi:hypothetical protein
MNELPMRRTISAIMLIIVLSACTTKVEISYSKIHKIDILSDNYRMVSTQNISDQLRLGPTDGLGGFFLIELTSKTDIEKIIRQQGMAFLYYELRSCGGAENSSELYSAPAYMDEQATSLQANSFYYYAPVPQNYRDEIDRYRSMRGEENAIPPSQICIGLGAGNMAGQSLGTNFVSIELK